MADEVRRRDIAARSWHNAVAMAGKNQVLHFLLAALVLSFGAAGRAAADDTLSPELVNRAVDGDVEAGMSVLRSLRKGPAEPAAALIAQALHKGIQKSAGAAWKFRYAQVLSAAVSDPRQRPPLDAAIRSEAAFLLAEALKGNRAAAEEATLALRYDVQRGLPHFVHALSDLLATPWPDPEHALAYLRDLAGANSDLEWLNQLAQISPEDGALAGDSDAARQNYRLLCEAVAAERGESALVFLSAIRSHEYTTPQLPNLRLLQGVGDYWRETGKKNTLNLAVRRLSGAAGVNEDALVGAVQASAAAALHGETIDRERVVSHLQAMRLLRNPVSVEEAQPLRASRLIRAAEALRRSYALPRSIDRALYVFEHRLAARSAKGR
jgi:hypothetical protein